MDHLRIKANKYEYKEEGRRLKEQFINCINDGDLITEIISELTAVKKTMKLPVNRYHWTEEWKYRRHKLSSWKP